MLKRILPRKKGLDEYDLQYRGFSFVIKITSDDRACAECQVIPKYANLFRTKDEQVVTPDGIEYTKPGNTCGIALFHPFGDEWTHNVAPIIQYQRLPKYPEDIELWKRAFNGDMMAIFKSNEWHWKKLLLVCDLKKRIDQCIRRYTTAKYKYRKQIKHILG